MGHINLQREGELDWFLLVRYSYCKLTGAISCSQEAYIDRLLVKYGMEHANPCKLPMNTGSDLESLPILDTPDKLVVYVYAALIRELLYIAINTVQQPSYSMCCLTRYMFKATPAHLTYAKVAISLEIKVASLLGAANVYLFRMSLVRFLLMSIQVGLMTRITGEAP